MPKHHILTAESLVVGSSITADLKQVVQTDLEAQKRAAEFALAEAQKLDAALKSSASADPLLKDAKDTLLKVAQLLAANTNATSSAVLEIVSSGTSGKPK
jgi:hypothetical protein